MWGWGSSSGRRCIARADQRRKAQTGGTRHARLGLAMGMALVGLASTGDALAQSGLDARPVNDTCIAADPPPLPEPELGTQRMFRNVAFDLPFAMVQPKGDGSRWFVAERGGKIKRLPNDRNTTSVTVVLDLEPLFVHTSRSPVGPGTDSQQWGITSIALHPAFQDEPHLFVAYNARVSEFGDVFSFVARYTAPSPDAAFDPASRLTLFQVEQPIAPHHVGQIAFGPDGLLYIGLGDGGFDDTAQDLSSLKGKILRVDVDSGNPYGIPADNPFADGAMGLPEIFAWGLRNPWRFSFDRSTGQLWLGDVGLSDREEVSIIEAGGNYGWPIKEGSLCVEPGCDDSGLIDPIYEYGHDEGNAIIGGFVYRGTAIPDLEGIYVFADFSSREIWGLQFDPSEGGEAVRDELGEYRRAHGFAEGEDGELYSMKYDIPDSIYKLVPAGPPEPPPDNVVAERLSETGCVDPDDPTQVAAGLIPYGINTPLWSDGAQKQRWLGLPDGETITLGGDGDLDFPEGTVLVKTFLFDDTPVETRLFMRHDDGEWAGYSYEWADDLSDALLLPAAKSKLLDNGVTWTFPSRAQCLQCHTEAAGFTLGPEVAQLNGIQFYPSTGREGNQLDTWEHIGLFDDPLPAPPERLPALAPPGDRAAPLDWRARSYLHANCAGCHRPNGPAQASIDLRYATKLRHTGLCNAPPQQGDLGVPGARLLLPGDPSRSILSLRIHALDAQAMPPLAKSLVDQVGASVIDKWISAPDVCNPMKAWLWLLLLSD